MKAKFKRGCLGELFTPPARRALTGVMNSLCMFLGFFWYQKLGYRSWVIPPACRVSHLLNSFFSRIVSTQLTFYHVQYILQNLSGKKVLYAKILNIHKVLKQQIITDFIAKGR